MHLWNLAIHYLFYLFANGKGRKPTRSTIMLGFQLKISQLTLEYSIPSPCPYMCHIHKPESPRNHWHCCSHPHRPCKDIVQTVCRSPHPYYRLSFGKCLFFGHKSKGRCTLNRWCSCDTCGKVNMLFMFLYIFKIYQLAGLYSSQNPLCHKGSF